MREYILSRAQKLIRQQGTRDPFRLIGALPVHLLVQNDLGRLKGFYVTVLRERYIVVNGNLDGREQRVVAAHELGHDQLHRKLARVAPLKDFAFFEDVSRTEYEANLFASELLVSDEDIEDGAAEGMDYFTLCKTLELPPQLVSFKLYGMIQRGCRVSLPGNLDSRFLGK